MARFEDEDGIEGPADRAWARAMREDAKKRRPIRTVRANDAGVLQPPVQQPPREDDAISAVFAGARKTIAELESKRVEPMTEIDWSPAQHVRRAS